MARPNKNWRKRYQEIDNAEWGTKVAFTSYKAFHEAIIEYAFTNGLEVGEVMRKAIAKHINWKGPLHCPDKEETGYTDIDLTIDEVAWIRYLKFRKWKRTEISRWLKVSMWKVNKALEKNPKHAYRLKYFPSIPIGGEKPPNF